MTYDDTNRGALFKNDKKEKENQPDYKGPINIDGVEKEIAAWLKTSQKGQKYMSLKISEKFVPKEKKQERAAQPEFDDPIPF